MTQLTTTSLADQLRHVIATIRRNPVPLAALIPLMQDAADELDRSHQREQDLAAQVDASDAKAYGAPVDDIAEFQLMALDDQGEPDELIAGTSGPRADSLLEIVRYMADVRGPAKLFEIVRVPVDLSVMGMGHA
jgi:hypothetical protein